MELLVPESYVAASRLGLFRLIGVEYSYEPEASRPQEIVDYIHGFDADFVPLFVKRLYRSPAHGDKMVGYHVLARHIAQLKRPIKKEGELGVDEKGAAMFHRPVDWPKKWYGGVYAISVLEGPRVSKSEPWGVFQPFDWRVAKVCEAQYALYRKASEDAKRKAIESQTKGEIERQVKAGEALEADGLARLQNNAIDGRPHTYVPSSFEGQNG